MTILRYRIHNRRRRRSRTTSILLAGTALVAVSPIVGVPIAGAAPGSAARQPAAARQAPDARATSRVPGVVTTSEQSTSTVTIDVPRGVTPTSVQGRLTTSQALSGRVTFSIGARVLRTVPARSGTVSLPVRRSDVTSSGTLPLTMTYGASTACPTGSGPAPITFGALRMAYTGQERAATDLAGFFPASPSRIDVMVPGNASDDVLQAGLAAVAALSSRYGSGTRVVMDQTGAHLPRVGLGQRVVRIAPGSGSVRTSLATRFGLQTLTVTGDPADLTRAAQALGSTQLKLATGGSTSLLADRLTTRDTTLERSLDDLGAGDLELSSPTPSSVFVGFKQDDFGGPVDQFDVHLSGTHTVVAPGTVLRLDTYVNDSLVDSRLLDGDDPRFTVDATIDSSLIKGDNGLQLTLTRAGGSGACTGTTGTGGPLTDQVFVDGQDSTITAQRGLGSATGFSLFPQALGGELPIAVRSSGSSRIKDAIDAAYVVAGLQDDAAQPIRVRLVDPDTFLDSDDNGLLVGATLADTDKLEAPLRLQRLRLLDYAQSQFQLGSDAPYAALQAVSHGGREVLLLGGWSPRSAAADQLTRRVAVKASLDWSALGSQLLVASGSGPAYTLNSNAIVPQSSTVEQRRSFVWYLLGAVVLLLLALLLQVARGRRRDRQVRVLVDAQERVDAERRTPGAGPDEQRGESHDDPRRP